MEEPALPGSEVWHPTALAARPGPVEFDKFLHYRNFELDVQRPGFVEKVQVPVLHGKGHNCALVGAYALDPQGAPYLIFKGGDTRLSRLLRGQPYVLLGFVGGRLDKVGADFPKIALGELPEEVGGEPVEGAFRRLGGVLSPTMPLESSESDAYFSAMTRLDHTPSGDGGGMELTSLLSARVLGVQAGLEAIDQGLVADGGRARTTYGRTLDAMGYVPQLGIYVQDHPELARRFDTLGLGEPQDPRPLAPPPGPSAPAGGGSAPDPVNSVEFVERSDLPVGNGATMVDGLTRHARDGVGEGEAFPNQVLSLPYDRAKVAVYLMDPVQGPMVCMASSERPVLSVKGLALGGECDLSEENTDLVRRDVVDMKLPRDQDPGSFLAGRLAGRLVQLAEPSLASSGQSDMAYHSYALEVPPPADRSDFVTLAEALRLCRTGQGDAQTEAVCLRLADKLGWIPQLGMSADEARKRLG